jgi:uncharacterized protein
MRPLPKIMLYLGVALALGLALSWVVGSAMVAGKASEVAEPRPPGRDVQIHSRDGLLLTGTYWPGRRSNSPAILLLHGVQSSRSSTADTATWLARSGYAALTIDFRGHGESSLSERSFGLHESRDVEAAFHWLKRRQRGARIAIIGNSLGGAAALLGPSGPVPADGLVLQAVYPDIRRAIRNRIATRLSTAPAYLLEPLLSFQSIPRLGVQPSGLSPLRALRQYRGPVFVIGGEEDRSTPPAETRALYAAAPGEKWLWLVPGRGHAAMGQLRDADYRGRISNFLEHSIGRP